MAEVMRLPPHSRMTAEECLAFCAAEAATYKDLLIVAELHDGTMVTRSSEMSRAVALWLAMFAADDARGLFDG